MFSLVPSHLTFDAGLFFVLFSRDRPFLFANSRSIFYSLSSLSARCLPSFFYFRFVFTVFLCTIIFYYLFTASSVALSFSCAIFVQFNVLCLEYTKMTTGQNNIRKQTTKRGNSAQRERKRKSKNRKRFRRTFKRFAKLWQIKL